VVKVQFEADRRKVTALGERNFAIGAASGSGAATGVTIG